MVWTFTLRSGYAEVGPNHQGTNAGAILTANTRAGRCGAACPESGTIGYVGVDSPDSAADPLDGSGIVISFDGDDTARFITPRGATGQVTLDCSAS